MNVSLAFQRIWLGLTSFKIIPQLDKYPRIVNYSQTLLGKMIIVAFFSLGLFLCNIAFWKELGIVLFILSLFPKQRKFLVVVASLYWLVDLNFLHHTVVRTIADDLKTTALVNWDTLRLDLILVTLLFCVLFYQIAVRFRDTLLLRRPILTLIVFYFVLLFIASYAPLPELIVTYLWGFIIVFKRFIWFLGYSLLDIRSKNPTPIFYQLGYYQAFWHGAYLANLPFPKGARYIKKIETKTPEELAVCQLKGLKLLYWAFVLIILHTMFTNVIYGEVGTLRYLIQIPYSFEIVKVVNAISLSASGTPLAWYSSWISLFAKVIDLTFYTAIMGHIIIACVRMSGYSALRSTYKPFAAKTLADFWNRFFYYFKEFLVEFFFYPVYLRYFKKWPRFRIFFATLCAAGFGNVLFHFLFSPKTIYELGLWQAIASFQVYIFFGLLFGTAIGISQLRNHRFRGEFPWYRKWITGPVCVFGFFAFVLIFDSTNENLTLIDHFVFVLSLFGLQG